MAQAVVRAARRLVPAVGIDVAKVDTVVRYARGDILTNPHVTLQSSLTLTLR